MVCWCLTKSNYMIGSFVWSISNSVGGGWLFCIRYVEGEERILSAKIGEKFY